MSFRLHFPARLAAMARAFALLLKNETDGQALLTPLNEPSFLSWAGGEVAYINPFAKDRGLDLKIQLARAVIESCEAIRGVLPEARFVHCEPAIHIAADPAKPQDAGDCRGFPAVAVSMAGFAGRL